MMDIILAKFEKIYRADFFQGNNLKGPVTLCNFLSNLSRNAIARQVAGELHNVNMGCLAIFFVARSVARSRTQFNFSQRIAAIDNTIAKCITPPILRQF